MGKVARYLNQLIDGDVFDNPEVLEAYSTGRSVLKIKPKLVALPESTEDVRKLMRFSNQLSSKGVRLPVTVRGSGLDEMGADLGNGIILSTEKLNKLLESDRRERLVRVQSGITLRELNTALSVNGLIIPIKGHDNETIGGLISNCPADDWSGKYGGISNFVERMEIVLPNGDILQTASVGRRAAMKKARGKNNEGRIYSKILQLMKKNESLLKVMQNNPTSLSGYQNIIKTINKSSIDFMPLFFGAEGTLGVITEVILKAVPIQKESRRVAAIFKDLVDAERFLELAQSLKPLELNLYDLRAVKVTEENGKKPNEITKKFNKGFVLFAKFDGKYKAKIRKIERFGKKTKRIMRLFVETNKNINAFNELESTLTSFVNRMKIDDIAPLMVGFSLPIKSLPDFVNDLKILEENLKLGLILYGSCSANSYNLTPKINATNEEFRKQAVNFLKTSAYVIKRQGGVVAGGLPEGRVKALAAENDLTEAEKSLYGGIKNAFDRQGILNPGVKTNNDSRFTIRHFHSL